MKLRNICTYAFTECLNVSNNTRCDGDYESCERYIKLKKEEKGTYVKRRDRKLYEYDFENDVWEERK